VASTKSEQRVRRVAEAEPPAQPLLRRAWDQISPIGLAVLIALAIRAVIIESYYVPSGSMFPTMLIGDHVFVSKFMFGAHVPFTGWAAPALRNPRRGEIAVFALGRKPNDREAGPDICPLDRCPNYTSEGFVKRIIGLPGDTVEYKNGQLILNDKPVEQRDLKQLFTDDNGVKYRVFEEDLGSCRHRTLDIPGTTGQSMERITVPPDRYFMMGDNRDNSNDSRVWGTVNRDDFKGPVLINYWSWNNQRTWPAMLNPITWIQLLFGEMRWGRFGMTFDCDAVTPTAPEQAPTAAPVPTP
jgi:signal peptidase I